MSTGRVSYGEHNGVQVLRFIGEIRYTLGPSLDKFLKNLCSGPTPKGFVIDLTQTDLLDSTSLGLLARVAKWMRKGGGPMPTLVSTNEDINDLLLAVGFDEVFSIVQSGIETVGDAQPLRLDMGGASELTATVLEAHRTLMELNDQNRAEFQDVVNMLQAEAGAPAGSL